MVSSSSGSEVVITSLLSGDFGSGRWSGGKATATDAWYEYRTAEGRKGKFTVVDAHITWTDEENSPHEVRYGVSGADYAAIREEPEEDSSEAEKGFGLSGRNGRAFKLGMDSEFGQLLASLYTNGLPESRVGKDIRGVIGVEATLIERPHAGVKDDKYPMLLASEVHNVPSGGSKGGSKRSARRDDDDEKPAPRRTARKAEPDEDEDTKPVARAAKGPAGRAVKMVLSALRDGNGTTTSSDVVRSAAKALKGDDDRKDILDMLGDDDWLAGREEWVYKRKTGEIIEA